MSWENSSHSHISSGNKRKKLLEMLSVCCQDENWILLLLLTQFGFGFGFLPDLNFSAEDMEDSLYGALENNDATKSIEEEMPCYQFEESWVVNEEEPL
jgi:hypothetical protein